MAKTNGETMGRGGWIALVAVIGVVALILLITISVLLLNPSESGLVAGSTATSAAKPAATTSSSLTPSTAVVTMAPQVTDSPVTQIPVTAPKVTDPPPTPAPVPVTTAPVAPRLGRPWAPDQLGYGEVRPSLIFNGGTSTGSVNDIVWDSWGGEQATGTGIGHYVAPGQASFEATAEPATVVASRLGVCNGVPSYLKVDWYFPGKGEVFQVRNTYDICPRADAP